MISKTTRDQVYAKSNGVCWYCGCGLNDKWHKDHFIPKRRGGTDDLINLVPSCVTCNLFKSTHLLEELREELSKRRKKQALK